MTSECWNVGVYVGETIVIVISCTISIFLYKVEDEAIELVKSP